MATTTIRRVCAAVCCGVLLWLVTLATADAASPATLLTNTGRGFEVRPATIVVGMVGITGPHVSGQEFRAGQYGHIRWLRWSTDAIGHGLAWVPNGPSGAVRAYPATVTATSVQGGRYTRLRWWFGSGSHRYTEWDKLMRFGRTYNWRYVRSTGNG